MQGSSKRFLQELQSGQPLPSLAIMNIRAILPNIHRINIRNQFLQACTDTIHFLCHLDINQDFRNNIHKDSMQFSLYMLTSIRIAYGGSADSAYSLKYGYADQREHVAISHISIWLAHLMWVMQRQSDTRRKEGLNNFPFEQIPRPLQFFLLLSYPTLLRFVHHDGFWSRSGNYTSQKIPDCWRLGVFVKTHKMGSTAAQR